MNQSRAVWGALFLLLCSTCRVLFLSMLLVFHGLLKLLRVYSLLGRSSCLFWVYLALTCWGIYSCAGYRVRKRHGPNLAFMIQLFPSEWSICRGPTMFYMLPKVPEETLQMGKPWSLLLGIHICNSSLGHIFQISVIRTPALRFLPYLCSPLLSLI